MVKRSGTMQFCVEGLLSIYQIKNVHVDDGEQEFDNRDSKSLSPIMIIYTNKGVAVLPVIHNTIPPRCSQPDLPFLLKKYTMWRGLKA